MNLKDQVREFVAFDELRHTNEERGYIRLAKAEFDRLAPLNNLWPEVVECLETLKVAVNDKQEDKGATNFIEQTLAKIKEAVGGS